MLTRRTLLAAGAATATSIAMPKMAFAAEKTDVVIIGAGLAGLHSAAMLGDLGFKTIVLEAQNRVGGRVCTHDTEFGRQDVGASQIGRGYARVIDACRRYGLELITEDRDLLPFATHFENQWIEHSQWPTHPLNRLVGEERKLLPMMIGAEALRRHSPLENLSDWLDPAFGKYDISLRQLMQQHGYSEEAMRLAHDASSIDDKSVLREWQEHLRGEYDLRIGNDNAHESVEEKRLHPFGEVNDRNLVGGLARINNIKGGTDLLPRAMAAQLGDRVRLNKQVARIEMTDKGATVTCTDGSSVKAKFVISAIPFSVLRKVEIVGKPSPVNQQAINEMPYGNTARMYLRIAKPFWKEDGLSPSFSSDSPMGMFWAIDNHTGEGEHRAMIVMVGRRAMEITKRPDAIPFLISELERLRPASKGLIKLATYKDWGADPMQLGCGFSYAPGQINKFGRDMINPWQVMHFAGEHTRRLDYGMEGAMESAERVTFEIAERA